MKAYEIVMTDASFWRWGKR